ncbi:hypothetical protein [Wolbachia endosymbiont of Ctenocephalides felis wCfeT]|uniref:hypothetical protein n=1 Tax=Wolbachia endosymbiont of Ctenocephalides felis wCfeT TaxID=2732593 RepID=UPI00144518BC|nr:hypothetical protein [Wolbachia endosymbiont of Ctenocephalides felis wCfeT]
MDIKAKINSKNRRLKAKNVGTDILISITIFAPFMLMGGLIAFLSFDSGKLTKCAKIVPKWAQFIKIEGITPEVNFLFYFALAFAIVVTALVICVLYNKHKNSKEMGENNLKLEILSKAEHPEKHEIKKVEEGYALLDKRYSGGCIVLSKTGKKAVVLEYVKEEQPGWHEYKVTEYQNREKSNLTVQDFSSDFFIKGNPERKDITVYECTLSLLSNVIIGKHTPSPAKAG